MRVWVERRNGFTLVEMAIVLTVIGLIVLAVFPALNTLRAYNQRSTTQANLQALLRATANYVQANGCVPCPAPPGATGASFGVIPGYSATTPCGTCASAAEGITPFMSLGVAASIAHDGWGHWITMRVDPALTNPANRVAPPTTPALCTCTFNGLTNSCTPSTGCACTPPVNNACAQPFNASIAGLCAANISAAGRIIVQTPYGASQQAAVIFVSHGANGYGSYLASALSNGTNGYQLPFPAGAVSCAPFSATNPVPPTKGFAQCNADKNNQFVDAALNISTNDSYDDLLAYADRNTLVSMFGNGSCQTIW